MAEGIVKVLPASTHQQILVGAGNTIYSSLRILNPNDGVCYVARNRDCPGTDYGSWDWKIPSQSYGMLPGPFQSAGIFYLDQSGAGRQGEVTLYPSLQKMDEPIFMAIGRAIAAAITTMDIVQGVQPGNPPTGTTREWSDGNGLLYSLLSTSANYKHLYGGQVLQSDIAPLLNNLQVQSNSAKAAAASVWTPFNFQIDIPAPASGSATWLVHWTAHFVDASAGPYPFQIDCNLWSWVAGAISGEVGSRQFPWIMASGGYASCSGFSIITGIAALSSYILAAFPTRAITESPGVGGAFSRIAAVRIA